MWSSSSWSSWFSGELSGSENFEDPVASRLALARLLEEMFGGPSSMVFDRYVPLDEQGVRGGMSVVYPAWDRGRHRKVAIKVMKSVDPAALSLLHVEAAMLSRVRHPNIVESYGIGTLNSVGVHAAIPILVMEWIDGNSLGRWLEESRSVAEVIELFVQAGRGLDRMHRAGIVHGDFKPNNVVVGLDGRARLVDFGLARPIESPAPRRTPHRPRGTPAYMAPEQKTAPADARSDQYCFCLSLHQALWGTPRDPGDGATRLHGLPRRDVPPWVIEIVLQGLDPDPARRFEDMRALLAALDVVGFYDA